MTTRKKAEMQEPEGERTYTESEHRAALALLVQQVAEHLTKYADDEEKRSPIHPALVSDVDEYERWHRTHIFQFRQMAKEILPLADHSALAAHDQQLREREIQPTLDALNKSLAAHDQQLLEEHNKRCYCPECHEKTEHDVPIIHGRAELAAHDAALVEEKIAPYKLSTLVATQRAQDLERELTEATTEYRQLRDRREEKIAKLEADNAALEQLWRKRVDEATRVSYDLGREQLEADNARLREALRIRARNQHQIHHCGYGVFETCHNGDCVEARALLGEKS